ncbi:MAG TPA: RNA-binding cell elongation regulator Jag/EloR, partial [Candidatus Diapherotrites archaeon]|nr:RNA-binding cell elongation regulator Jag/EloR [Candidatus Diapherotrites archaeon]
LEKERARKFLRDVLEAMDIKAEIRVKDINESLYINLSGPKMGMIIGRRGQTLDSLQYLVSLVVNKDKERDSFVKVILDTEDYRRKREETLQRLAKRLADRARKTGKNIELEPMNPYERRIIHSTLQEVEGITTFSEGEEPYRKVIISNK